MASSDFKEPNYSHELQALIREKLRAYFIQKNVLSDKGSDYLLRDYVNAEDIRKFITLFELGASIKKDEKYHDRNIIEYLRAAFKAMADYAIQFKKDRELIQKIKPYQDIQYLRGLLEERCGGSPDDIKRFYADATINGNRDACFRLIAHSIHINDINAAIEWCGFGLEQGYDMSDFIRKYKQKLIYEVPDPNPNSVQCLRLAFYINDSESIKHLLVLKLHEAGLSENILNVLEAPGLGTVKSYFSFCVTAAKSCCSENKKNQAYDWYLIACYSINQKPKPIAKDNLAAIKNAISSLENEKPTSTEGLDSDDLTEVKIVNAGDEKAAPLQRQTSHTVGAYQDLIENFMNLAAEKNAEVALRFIKDLNPYFELILTSPTVNLENKKFLLKRMHATQDKAMEILMSNVRETEERFVSQFRSLPGSYVNFRNKPAYRLNPYSFNEDDSQASEISIAIQQFHEAFTLIYLRTRNAKLLPFKDNLAERIRSWVQELRAAALSELLQDRCMLSYLYAELQGKAAQSGDKELQKLFGDFAAFKEKFENQLLSSPRWAWRDRRDPSEFEANKKGLELAYQRGNSHLAAFISLPQKNVLLFEDQKNPESLIPAATPRKKT